MDLRGRTPVRPIRTVRCMTNVIDTAAMLKGRVRGGMSDTKGVLLFTDRAWGAARIEEDGTTSSDGGPLGVPSWLRLPGLRPLGSIVLFRRAARAAHRYWEDRPEAGKGSGWLTGFVAGAVVLAVMGLVSAIPGLLVPVWPLREVAQGLTLLVLHIAVYAVIRTSDGDRVLKLHGAEHMCAAGLDEGAPLTPKALSRFTPEHARCGSNLLVTLYAVGTVVHVALGLLHLPLLPAVALRLVALPLMFLVATIAHRLLAKLWDVPVIGAIAVPGRYVQRLSVAQPDPASLEVAIVSARALMVADVAARCDDGTSGTAPVELAA